MGKIAKHGKWRRAASHAPRTCDELKNLIRQVQSSSSSSDGALDDVALDCLFEERFSNHKSQGATPSRRDQKIFAHRLQKIEDPAIDATEPEAAPAQPIVVQPTRPERESEYLTDPNVFPAGSMWAVHVDDDISRSQYQAFNDTFGYELPIRPQVEQNLNQEMKYAWEGKDGEFHKPRRHPTHFY